MNDYSDIIFLMGAMIMFSLLTLNVSRSMVMNTKELSKSEIEYNAIALAHSYLERAQWATEEELTRSPHGDFMFESTNKPSGCDFTKNNPCIETLELGPSGSQEVEYYVYVKIQDNVSTPGSTDNKEITVGVTSPYFYEQYDDTFSEYPIEMNFINSFDN